MRQIQHPCRCQLHPWSLMLMTRRLYSKRRVARCKPRWQRARARHSQSCSQQHSQPPRNTRQPRRPRSFACQYHRPRVQPPLRRDRLQAQPRVHCGVSECRWLLKVHVPLGLTIMTMATALLPVLLPQHPSDRHRMARAQLLLLQQRLKQRSRLFPQQNEQHRVARAPLPLPLLLPLALKPRYLLRLRHRIGTTSRQYFGRNRGQKKNI